MRRTTMAIAAVVAVSLAGCSGGTAATSDTPTSGFKPGVLNTDYAGTTISEMVPSWAALSDAQLAEFKSKTGITVDQQVLSWDSIHDKVVTTSASGQAAADVVEMDWTWVSQFGAAGWFTSLTPYLSPSLIQSTTGASAFVQGGKQIGLPYALDFRGTIVDMTDLKQAGITTPPTTWDEVLTDSTALKAAGVTKYPVGIPLSVTEGSATPWYGLVLAAGGSVLTSDGKPAFEQGGAGEDAFAFVRDLYAAGDIDPGSVELSDEQVANNFGAGQSAFLLSAGPGGLEQFADPTKSSITSHDLRFIPMPGRTGSSGVSIGLQEALSIPKASSNKEAAAMFITWRMEPEQQLASYASQDLLPVAPDALSTLADQGKVNKTILDVIKTVRPLVDGGTPTWYSKFSPAVASTLQSVALGTQSPADGVASLAKQTTEFANG